MKPKMTPGCSDMGVTEESPKSVSEGQARGRRARAPGGAGSGRASPRGAAVSRPEAREGTWGGPVVGGFHLQDRKSSSQPAAAEAWGGRLGTRRERGSCWSRAPGEWREEPRAWEDGASRGQGSRGLGAGGRTHRSSRN